MKRLRPWLIYWTVWVAMALWGAVGDKLMFPKSGFMAYLLPLNLLQNLAWGLLGLLILKAARRFPIEEFAWRTWRTWTLHGVLSLVVTAAGLLLALLANYPFTEPSHRPEFMAYFPKRLLSFFRNYYQTSLFTMWGVLGAYHVIRAHQRMRERDLQAAQLESRLAQAQNQALRMQLQPHFLFNTLNSISALIHDDPEAADRMLGRLADLLRLTLDAGASQEVPLRQELSFIEGYLGIERIRFQDRLRVCFTIPPDCMEARVPSFLLQPLVENSIRHGVAGLSRPSTIEVRARRDGEWLELEVTDDGKGFEKGREGIGTTNTASRLRLLYRDRQSFLLLSEPGVGTTARIRIPWQEGEPSACAP